MRITNIKAIMKKGNVNFKHLFSILILLTLSSYILLGKARENAVYAMPNPSENLSNDLTNLEKRIDQGATDLETWEYELIVGVLRNVALGIAGSAPPSVQGVQTGSVNNIGSVGLGGVICHTTAHFLEQPPSLQPVNHLARMFRIPWQPQQAYAQTGTTLLSNYGFETLWKTSRNVCYALLSIVLIIIGVMIMFRVEVSKRTIMTLQLALPRIVMSLILITFSYAIGGFFIDLVAILKNLLGNMFNIPWANLGNLFGQLTWAIAGLPGHGSGMISQIPNLEGALSGIVSITMFVLVGLMVIVALITIFVKFIAEWVNLFIRTAFAPFFILIGTLPGENNTMFSWLKGMLASAIAIPLTGFGLWIAHAFVDPASGFSEIQGPGLVAQPGLVNALVAFGILLIVPSIPAAVKDALDVLTPSGVSKQQLEVSDLMRTAGMINPFT